MLSRLEVVILRLIGWLNKIGFGINESYNSPIPIAPNSPYPNP
jgi:hypothetical protein